MEHLSSFCYTIQVGKHCKKETCRRMSLPCRQRYHCNVECTKNALIGEFIHQHPMGPIVWEQTRYEQDAYYCENNIITTNTNVVGCANNASPITSTTSGEAAEEYLSEYMVMEKSKFETSSTITSCGIGSNHSTSQQI
jgi:hypothetical protein